MLIYLIKSVRNFPGAFFVSNYENIDSKLRKIVNFETSMIIMQFLDIISLHLIKIYIRKVMESTSNFNGVRDLLIIRHATTL